MKLTMVISKGEEFFIGTLKEIPEVLTQGKTIEEAKQNVLDALETYLEDMRDNAGNSSKDLEYELLISLGKDF